MLLCSEELLTKVTQLSKNPLNIMFWSPQEQHTFSARSLLLKPSRVLVRPRRRVQMHTPAWFAIIVVAMQPHCAFVPRHSVRGPHTLRFAGANVTRDACCARASAAGARAFAVPREGRCWLVIGFGSRDCWIARDELWVGAGKIS